jgi:catechol 2,3-dioxygenase-like lactoylglutathione lyase family enzyme
LLSIADEGALSSDLSLKTGGTKMETPVTSASTGQDSTTRPSFSGMSHISLPCRDLEESKIFYSEVMGGELVHQIAGFVEYKIEDIIIGLSEQHVGWTGFDDEYPHYAFYIDGANFGLMKSWLDSHGVPNYPYCRDKTALIYFRDPSGNLFELYCDSGYEKIGLLRPAPRRGGPPIDFCRLNYRWDSERAARGSKREIARPHFTAFAHASIFCRDLEQAKRFFIQVLGGELIHDVDGFAEVRIAEIIIGLTARPGTTTGWDVEYPHYAFFVEAEDFLPMVSWLRQNGVTTSEPWTRDGIKGLLYFRDPSGNLFEIYCRKLNEASSFTRGAKQGGSYTLDFAALNYQWNG